VVLKVGLKAGGDGQIELAQLLRLVAGGVNADAVETGRNSGEGEAPAASVRPGRAVEPAKPRQETVALAIGRPLRESSAMPMR
jgi:hypothetical protein